MLKLRVRKTYCYEPGKTSPLPPIPTTENDDIKCDSKTESKITVDVNDKLSGNHNEFQESQEKIKRSSLTIDEKKMLPEAIEYEESKNILVGRIHSLF